MIGTLWKMLDKRLMYAEDSHKVPLFSFYWPKWVQLKGLEKTRIQLGEEVTPEFKKACVAEFIAMMMFVVMCCGCAMVNLALPSPNLMTVASSFGFGIMVLAQFVGPLSGGHINCAVTWALFVAGRVSLVKCICYTASQMWGSIFGALFLWAIFGNNWPAARAFGSNSWDETIFTGGQVFLSEMVGTMLLVYCVFATIDCPVKGGGPLGVYPIAMSVMVAHLFLLPIDGCSINPTRSFGPSLVAAFAGIGGTYYHQQVRALGRWLFLSFFRSFLRSFFLYYVCYTMGPHHSLAPPLDPPPLNKTHTHTHSTCSGSLPSWVQLLRLSSTSTPPSSPRSEKTRKT